MVLKMCKALDGTEDEVLFEERKSLDNKLVMINVIAATKILGDSTTETSYCTDISLTKHL